MTMNEFVTYITGKNGLHIGECDIRIPGNTKIEFDGRNKMKYEDKEYSVGNLRGAIKAGWLKSLDGSSENIDTPDDPYMKKNKFIEEQSKKKYKFDQYDIDQSQAEDNVVDDFKNVDKITENSSYKKRDIIKTSEFKGEILIDDENQGDVVSNINEPLKDNEINLPDGFKKFNRKQKEEFIQECSDLKTLRYLKDKEYFSTKKVLNDRIKKLTNG